MRTGIFGGTFDPIHNGHLLSAAAIKDVLKLDKIVFIPTGEPPHKVARRVTPSEDRLAMVKLAVEDNEIFEVSDIECRRNNYTYTYDTLKELNEKAQPDEEFFMIIGADTLADVFNWYRSEDVFKMCSFVAMKRPGSDNEIYENNLKRARAAGAVVHTAEIPQFDISSTKIREAISKNEDLSEYVPTAVAEYIKANNLYHPGKMTFEEICKDLKKLLSDKRYYHCVCVAAECVRLAEIFGADVEKCRLAGILHDCAKELTQKQYFWIGLKPDCEDDFDGKQVLLHAEAGAILAKERYGVCDSEVLEAIRCHITGKPQMSLISQVLFLADYTSSDREGTTHDDVREKIAEGKIYEAMLEECDATLIYNIKRDMLQLCTQTVRTRNWIVSKIKEKK